MLRVDCPSCGAGFDVDFPVGTEFACGSCGGTVVVPGAAPPPRVVRPAARPGSTPKPMPSPIVRPAAKAATPRQPVEAPAEAPVRTPLRGTTLHRTTGTVPMRKSSGEKKFPLPLPALIGAGVLVVGGILAVVLSAGGGGGGSNRGDPGQTPEAPKVPTPPADPYVALKKRAEAEGGLALLLDFGEQAWKKMEAAKSAKQDIEARRFESDARWAYRQVVAKNPDHDVAQSRLGNVLFDKAVVERYLKTPSLRQYETDLQILLEELEEKRLKGKSKLWLPETDAYGKRWKELVGRIEKNVATESAKEKDPFYKEAESLGQSVIRRLRRAEPDVNFLRKGVTGEPFVLMPHKPYVFIIQRDVSGGEDRTASDWGSVMDALQESFYSRYAEKTGLLAMSRPTPILVLRASEEYTKYNRMDDASRRITSAGHYEPSTNLLVVYRSRAEQELDTLFHEGTHQIVEWGMKTAGTDKGLRQALWFSEGIADFFGGHGKEYDKDLGRNVFIPGRLNKERIETLAKSKETGSLFPLAELLDYRRYDYVQDNADPTKSIRVANAYAQGWGLTYLLNNWQDGKWKDRFVTLVKREFAGDSGKAVFAEVFGEGEIAAIEKEFLLMIDELGAALKEGRIVEGKLLPKK